MEESCDFINNKAEAIREEILGAISKSMSPCVKLHAFELLRGYGVSLSLGV